MLVGMQSKNPNKSMILVPPTFLDANPRVCCAEMPLPADWHGVEGKYDTNGVAAGEEFGIEFLDNILGNIILFELQLPIESHLFPTGNDLPKPEKHVNGAVVRLDDARPIDGKSRCMWRLLNILHTQKSSHYGGGYKKGRR